MATTKSQKYKIFGNRFGTGNNPNFITAIREIRALTGSGLKESKDAYDGIAPLYFEHVKNGSQKSLLEEKSLNDIHNYGCNVVLESVSGCKIGDKELEEKYLTQAQRALERYAKKLIDNHDAKKAIEVLHCAYRLELLDKPENPENNS